MDDTDPDQGLTRLFDLHYPALHRYLHRRVGPVLAEDLAAQTFVEALRGHDPARADPAPWLYGIAHNLLRRHHRQERRQLRAFARSRADLVVADDTDAIAARLDPASQGPNLAVALRALNARDRDVLLLFAWAAWTTAASRRLWGSPPARSARGCIAPDGRYARGSLVRPPALQTGSRTALPPCLPRRAMDELELIAKYRAEIGEPHPDDVARVRATVLASATGARPRTRLTSRTRLRFAVAGLTVAGLLAALVIPGSGLLAPSGTPPDNRQAARSQTTTGQPPAAAESPPPQARQVLVASADRALRLPERAGTYWYSKLLSPGSRPQDRPRVVEHWTSRSRSRSISSDAPYCPTPVDSDTGACIPKPAPDDRPLCPRIKPPKTRDREALERELQRLREIVQTCRPRPSPPTDSTPNDLDVPLRFSLDLTMTETMRLPTNPAALAKVLKNRIRAAAGGPVRDLDGSLFYHSGQLLQSAPLTSGTRSALFRIMADLDKVKLLGTLTDPAGRAWE